MLCVALGAALAADAFAVTVTIDAKQRHQTIIGWGWVEAPEEEREQISEIYADIIRTWEPTEQEDEPAAAEATEPDETPGEKADRGRLGLKLLAIFIVLLAFAILLALIRSSWGPKTRHRIDIQENRRIESIFTAGRSA